MLSNFLIDQLMTSKENLEDSYFHSKSEDLELEKCLRCPGQYHTDYIEAALDYARDTKRELAAYYLLSVLAGREDHQSRATIPLN